MELYEHQVKISVIVQHLKAPDRNPFRNSHTTHYKQTLQESTTIDQKLIASLQEVTATLQPLTAPLYPALDPLGSLLCMNSKKARIAFGKNFF